MTGNVGRVCKVDTRNTLLNQRVGRLNPINVEVSFLYYLLNDRKFIKQMIIIAQG
jgi:restriction endonuclease S subunit